MNYSIIIPHYNTPNLLQRLLNSIPQRNDLEIIVVDDNSKANTVDFEHFPGINRGDVKVVFDKKGGGGGYARNIGLSYATGERVIFADSDDFFNYCFNDILDEYSNSEYDIIYCKANSLDSIYYTNTYRTEHLNSYIDHFFDGDKTAELNLRYLFGEPWCKIIRSKIITRNNIKFDETSIHNDTTFSYLCGFYAETITVDKRAIYCVTSREGSVSKQVSEAKKLERISVFSRSYMFFKKHGIKVKENRHFKQLYNCKRENRSTYEQGVKIMRTNGISSKIIKQQMIKQIYCHLYVFVLVKKIGRYIKNKVKNRLIG